MKTLHDSCSIYNLMRVRIPYIHRLVAGCNRLAKMWWLAGEPAYA